MDELLQVKDLVFSYEEKPVLKKINVTVKKGERIAVMGSNGAGKSTFFLNLSGVYQPDGGEIWLDGKKLSKKNYKELHKRIGFVFQDADSQIIAGNVKAEISFGPMNLGLSREEVKDRVSSAIDYLNLKELEDRAPQYLSGGEKKRVSIADILAMETDVMIFDEPMAALDPVNAQNVENILNRLHEDGKTLLIATHDVDFAYRMADRILVFAGGEIIADGTPQEVFHKKEIMEKAHLKAPAVMTIWEAIGKSLQEEKNVPVTVEDLVERIQHFGSTC